MRTSGAYVTYVCHRCPPAHAPKNPGERRGILQVTPPTANKATGRQISIETCRQPLRNWKAVSGDALLGISIGMGFGALPSF